jgi:hypothetical protein
MNSEKLILSICVISLFIFEKKNKKRREKLFDIRWSRKERVKKQIAMSHPYFIAGFFR